VNVAPPPLPGDRPIVLRRVACPHCGAPVRDGGRKPKRRAVYRKCTRCDASAKLIVQWWRRPTEDGGELLLSTDGRVFDFALGVRLAKRATPLAALEPGV
jgi:hypothetical protein